MRLLILGHTWPEATTTAAGGRMLQLVELFHAQAYQIHFASTAEVSERTTDLSDFQLETHRVQLNDSGFDAWIAGLQPDVVLFDRFMTEEQFGWRVSEACPKALKILDTEDLHFLRQARQQAIKEGVEIKDAMLFTDLAKRELASIWRCDLSLMISEFEYSLLLEQFAIPRSLLFYLPFLVADQANAVPGFADRSGFICVGNFKHAPNLDAVLQLKEIWPAIRQQLPDAKLSIYGAYASEKALAWHDPSNGFYLEGWVEDLPAEMQNSRVQLAPIRFGAGLKGKILDAMLSGTPTVTTPVGAEGMHGELAFPGSICSNKESFVAEAVRLYTDRQAWTEASAAAKPILEQRFNHTLYEQDFQQRVDAILSSLEAHRNTHFMGQILQHNQLNSLKFMSKWIEEKNKNA